MWQDLTLGETICNTLSGFLAHNLERLVGPEDAKALQQPGVRARLGVCGGGCVRVRVCECTIRYETTDRLVTTPQHHTRRQQSRELQRVVGGLQLMTELLRLPSLRAAAALVPGWMLIVKLDRLRDLRVLEPLLPHMLGAYCDKSVKLRWDEEAGGFPDSPVADEEFIDLEVGIGV